ncbi:MAG: arginyltransferase [Saezia sp.]
MSGVESKQLLTLQSYLTHPYECSYLPDRRACSEVVVPAHLIDTHVYAQLVDMGFRRSGLFVYRPACDSCRACVPIRVLVDAFEPSKNQKKANRQLTHLEASVFDLRDTDEYYRLYQKYQNKRHSGGGMDEDKRTQYQEFLGVSGVNTKVVEYREASANDALRMVSIVDILSDGLSAVYTYYDPDNEKRSYGTYGILWQIAYAKKLGLPYVYLGYWVRDCQKMSYKSNFQPFEVLTDQGWQRFDGSKLL